MAKQKTGRPAKWTKEKLFEIADDIWTWMNASNDNLFYLEYSVQAGLYDNMIQDYRHKYPEFNEKLRRCDDLLHARLLNGAVLTKKGYHAGFVKFLLINKYNYVSEKSQQQVEVKDAKNIKFNFGNDTPVDNE